MGVGDGADLTEQQTRWFAAVREGLERETGRSLEAWAELARACPETRHRARLAWMKATHGLGQNRASLVLEHAFPSAPRPAETAEDPLWADPHARAVFEAVRAATVALEEVLVGRRKGYTALSRRYQFAAVRPLAGGAARLGLALAPDADPRLSPRGRQSWSERLTAVLDLASPQAVEDGVAALLQQAWARS